ncbi:hypothetical protein Droror1_Dr00027568 [Drosera rotundifolia]
MSQDLVSLHLFSSCLEWRFVLPLLEEAGLESWVVDILGWGFSDLATIFGNALRLESLKPEKKLMWKKEMSCLLSVCDYIVELVPPSVNEPELETRHWEQQI